LLISQTVEIFFKWKATKYKFFSKLGALEFSVKLPKMYLYLSVIFVINTGTKDLSAKADEKPIVYFRLCGTPGIVSRHTGCRTLLYSIVRGAYYSGAGRRIYATRALKITTHITTHTNKDYSLYSISQNSVPTPISSYR